MRFFFFVIILLLQHRALSQSSVNDTTFLSASAQTAIDQYEASLEGQQLYYNGSAYRQNTASDDEHPFFLIDDFVPCTIQFDGNTFYNVPLIYDISSGEVISETPTGNLFVLSPRKLQYFIFQGRHFEWLAKDSLSGLPRTGFYEIVYSGATRLVVFYEKNRQEKISTSEIHTYYDEKTRYFILKHGTYHLIRNRRSLLNILSDKKQMLKAAMRNEQMNFKAERARAYGRAAAVYDSLKVNQ